jgi:predicted amidohydrolase
LADKHIDNVGKTAIGFLMKVGFVQFDPLFGEKRKNFEKIENILKNSDADIIVLPELFNTGYTFLNKQELSELAEPAQGGETAEFILSLAHEMNCSFAYGFAERQNNNFYNSAALVSPDGFLGVYRKIHLYFEEKSLFQPGNTGFNVLEYNGVKLGMIICFDWIYPESMRTLALKGAQIILHPANLVMSHCPDANITRAIENRIFIITANRTGEENRDNKKYTFIGKSEIVSPEGEILVRADTEKCLRICDIDPALALDKKINPLNDLFKDRREGYYYK